MILLWTNGCRPLFLERRLLPDLSTNHLEFIMHGAFLLLLVLPWPAASVQQTRGGSQPAAASETGSIVGSVAYRADPKRRWRYSRYYIKNPKTGRLAEAVVGLRGRSLRKSAPSVKARTATIDQKNFLFTPETVAIRAGDSVQFTNSDDATHNVRATHALANMNASMPKGGDYVHRFDKAGGARSPVRIGCAYHGAMRAWVFVFDHPHFKVTDASGDFRFTEVPAGEYDLEVRHPAGSLSWRMRVRVAAGKTTKLDVVVSPDDLQGSIR